MKRALLWPSTETCPEEEWRDVPGFEGLYRASNTGFIKSVGRVIVKKDRVKQPIRERILRKSCTGTICLYKNGKMYSYNIGNLILRAFIGPPPSEAERNARHLDDDTDNNHLSNLAWGTPQDNYNDGVRNNRHGPGTPGAIIRGDKLRGRKRPDVDTRRKNLELLNEQSRARPRDANGKWL